MCIIESEKGMEKKRRRYYNGKTEKWKKRERQKRVKEKLQNVR